MPDFDVTKVNDDALRRYSNSIEENLRDAQASFERINNALMTILAPSWDGLSKNVFFQQYGKDSKAFLSHLQALRLLNDKLNEAAGMYGGAEGRVLDSANKLKTK